MLQKCIYSDTGNPIDKRAYNKKKLNSYIGYILFVFVLPLHYATCNTPYRSRRRYRHHHSCHCNSGRCTAFAKGDKVGSYGDTTQQGIDVSHHQGYIDWEMVAADGSVKFAYIKASEGTTHQDTRYDYNITEARKGV